LFVISGTFTVELRFSTRNPSATLFCIVELVIVGCESTITTLQDRLNVSAQVAFAPPLSTMQFSNRVAFFITSPSSEDVELALNNNPDQFGLTAHPGAVNFTGSAAVPTAFNTPAVVVSSPIRVRFASHFRYNCTSTPGSNVNFTLEANSQC
jgi:hypothetical protein